MILIPPDHLHNFVKSCQQKGVVLTEAQKFQIQFSIRFCRRRSLGPSPTRSSVVDWVSQVVAAFSEQELERTLLRAHFGPHSHKARFSKEILTLYAKECPLICSPL